uniref:Uncharacterized protein n=1 Tax=viral metagenome TaxID=1070528 RepID=A0A6C0JD23_9ZZZZ
MSSTRTMYDKTTTANFLKSSRGPGFYQIDTPKDCNDCFQSNPSVRLQKNGVSIQRPDEERFYAGPVDIESDLLGVGHGESKDYTLLNQCDNPDDQYSCVFGAGNGNTNKDVCLLRTEDTRLSNPAANLRGTCTNRFDPLCLDPQKGVIPQNIYDISSRNVIKDNFKPCVATPAINSMLPPQIDLPGVQTIIGAVGSYTRPLYQYDKCG